MDKVWQYNLQADAQKQQPLWLYHHVERFFVFHSLYDKFLSLFFRRYELIFEEFQIRMRINMYLMAQLGQML